MEAAAGLTQEALDQGRKFPSLVNLAVETLVASGKYSEALAIPLQFLLEGATDAVNKVLVQINLSEAEYNLGRWQQSLSRLSTLDESAAPFDIARAGLALQRAWILAHVAARQRDWARADSLCQAAAEHRYRGQGGDGLLLWGDVLTELGRVGPARHAYELATSRDGQSESAT